LRGNDKRNVRKICRMLHACLALRMRSQVERFDFFSSLRRVTKGRHCERREAIQMLDRFVVTLLAMT
jgi:hypothetical protein